jgi:hypothetical protein
MIIKWWLPRWTIYNDIMESSRHVKGQLKFIRKMKNSRVIALDYVQTAKNLAYCRRFDPGGGGGGVPGPTSKFFAACPTLDGLAQDGTQGRNAARVISHQGGVLVVGVTSVHEREREWACSSARSPARPSRMKALDLPFIDARRGSKCTMGV